MYDKKFIYKCLAGFAAMMLAMKLTGGAGYVLIFGLFVAAATKRNALLLLYGIAMSIAMLVGNNVLMPKGSIFGITQRSSMLLLSFLLITQVLGQRREKCLSCFLLMLVYILYMIAVSFAGWCPPISFLKLTLFTAVFMAYFGVATIVSNSKKDLTPKVRGVFLSIAIFFIFGSILLIPFPGISQLTGQAYIDAIKSGADITSLFTGMTFHSQSLGPIVACLGVALFADLLFAIKRPDKLYIALLICVPFLIWKATSRTAMGTFLIGVLFCVQMFISARGIKSRWKGKVTSALLMISILLSFVVLIIPNAREKAMGFVLKYKGSQVSAEQVSVDDVLSTRRGKWEQGIRNWKKSMVIGNGFQVSENMVGMQVGLSTLSAPVEKSVWIAAVLEEGGIFGFIIFMIFVITTFASLYSYKSYVGLSCYISLMIVNLGEFTLFSMSGIGGFLWALVFIGVMLDIGRYKGNIICGQRPRMNGYYVAHAPINYNPMWR